MSAKKTTDTKITKEENPDSGFLSGPIDYVPGDSEDLSRYGNTQDSDKVSSSVSKDQGDSGVCCISDLLSDVQLSRSGVRNVPEIRLQGADLLSIALLFQPDADGDTSLHIAAVHGCEKSIATLIRFCPNKDWLDIPNNYGLTALHLTVMGQNSKLTRMLVLAGASLGVRDRRGETPLHKATMLCDVKSIHALLSPVEGHLQRKLSSVLDQKNYSGQACVHLAASAGHLDTLHTLVLYGCDINSMENLAGRTPLHIAAQRGDVRVVRYLRKKAAANKSARDFAGRKPRHFARKNAAAVEFQNDSDSDSDSDDDMYESEGEAEDLFDRIRESIGAINVA